MSMTRYLWLECCRRTHTNFCHFIHFIFIYFCCNMSTWFSTNIQIWMDTVTKRKPVQPVPWRGPLTWDVVDAYIGYCQKTTEFHTRLWRVISWIQTFASVSATVSECYYTSCQSNDRAFSNPTIFTTECFTNIQRVEYSLQHKKVSHSLIYFL